MKYFIISIFAMSLIVCGCRNRSDSPKNEIKPDSATTVRIDTFAGKDINGDLFLPSGIRLDTIQLPPNIHHREIDIVMPVITSREHPWLHKELKKFRDESLNEFIASTKDYIRDTGERAEMDGEYMYIEPQSLYKTDSVVSFILEIGSGSGPAGFIFVPFNYDNRTKKRILFGEYFKLDTPGDSVLLAKSLAMTLGRDEIHCRILVSIPDFEFGFDEENVYFCFERYHIMGRGILSVKKKYLSKYIRPAFR
jgi:hypothetical protein